MVCQIKSTDCCFFAYLKGLSQMENNKTNTKTALLNTEETYINLQPFATIEQLNENTKEIRSQFADQMTPSTYAVLDVLHRYASKYYGVSYRSKAKIAIELGVSRRTVIRACNTLEAMGVIEQYELMRHNGDCRQSSNAIVFVKVYAPIAEVVVQAEVTPECHGKDAPTNALKSKSINTYVTQAEVIHSHKSAVTEVPRPEDKSHLHASLPDGWYEQAVAYATDYNDLYRITGELYKAKKNVDILIESYAEEFGEVLRTAWVRLKHGRINPSSWYAYLYTAFKKTAVALSCKERHAPMQRKIEEMMLRP